MSSHSRRAFLRRAAALTGGLLLPGAASSGLTTACSSTSPAFVEVTGRVASGSTGLANVPVSDGLTVVTTDADGRFSFHAPRSRPFVQISVPRGYRIPQNAPGTARFYQPLRRSGQNTVATEFQLAPVEADDEAHAFVVLADPQTQTPAEMEEFHATTVPDVQQTLDALPHPAFGVGCGDLMYDDLSLFPEYERAVRRMGVPFFQVVGNHDLDFDAPTDAGSTATFERHFGPRYYSFNRGAVHYVVLDDVFWPGSDGFGTGTDDYLGYIDHDQLRWLEQDLALVEAGRPVIVFAHIPPLSTLFERRGREAPSARNQITNRAALYALLDPFDAHILCGHVHENEHRTADGPHEHVISAASGAWWTGPVAYDGTPAGYAVYQVDGTDVSWRFKATGHPTGYQMRVYPPGTDPEAPRRLLANVWDADPEWTVVWFEDGIRAGAMTRERGTDPTAERLYRGADQPTGRTWITPVLTDHLYTANVSPTAERIRVEATDRFGRTYVGRS